MPIRKLLHLARSAGQGLRDEARATWGNALKENPDNEVLPATIKRFEP